MKREDCWMTFSEALEAYLCAREMIAQCGEGRRKESLREDLDQAAAHMDAMAGNES